MSRENPAGKQQNPIPNKLDQHCYGSPSPAPRQPLVSLPCSSSAFLLQHILGAWTPACRLMPSGIFRGEIYNKKAKNSKKSWPRN